MLGLVFFARPFRTRLLVYHRRFLWAFPALGDLLGGRVGQPRVGCLEVHQTPECLGQMRRRAAECDVESMELAGCPRVVPRQCGNHPLPGALTFRSPLVCGPCLQLGRRDWLGRLRRFGGLGIGLCRRSLGSFLGLDRGAWQCHQRNETDTAKRNSDVSNEWGSDTPEFHKIPPCKERLLVILSQGPRKPGALAQP